MKIKNCFRKSLLTFRENYQRSLKKKYTSEHTKELTKEYFNMVMVNQNDAFHDIMDDG